MKPFAILGHPVAHSRSPELHNAVFQQLGLKDYHYDFYDCPPEKLEQAMKELREGKYQGFSVTIPHKQAVMQYLDDVSERAKMIGAVNTIVRKGSKGSKGTEVTEGSDGMRLFGDNTDYVGFRKSLEESGLLTPDHRRSMALVLGSGGASKAIVAVLQDLGYAVTVASRTKKDGVLIYDELDPDADWKMIVNTTPVGMEKVTDGTEGELLLSDSRWYRKDRVYMDIIYTPKITSFLQRALDVGAKIITGDRMFLWQAVEQAKMFTRRDEIPVEVMERVLDCP